VMTVLDLLIAVAVTLTLIGVFWAEARRNR
jgi:hypothetical protein